jgi:hypothetical protein
MFYETAIGFNTVPMACRAARRNVAARRICRARGSKEKTGMTAAVPDSMTG